MLICLGKINHLQVAVLLLYLLLNFIMCFYFRYIVVSVHSASHRLEACLPNVGVTLGFTECNMNIADLNRHFACHRVHCYVLYLFVYL